MAVAVAIDAGARVGLAPVPGLILTIFGIGLGGFVAGKWADSAGLYHGAMVGAGWVLLSAIGIAPSPSYSSDLLTDTAAVIVLDVLTLGVASLGGWIARRGPSASSGTGRAR